MCLLQHDNERGYKQLESLIRSLAALIGSLFGIKPNDDEPSDNVVLDDDDPNLL